MHHLEGCGLWKAENKNSDFKIENSPSFYSTTNVHPEMNSRRETINYMTLTDGKLCHHFDMPFLRNRDKLDIV